MVARSKAWVCGRSHTEIERSKPAGAWMSVVNVVCCQVEVSTTKRSLVQKSPAECGVISGNTNRLELQSSVSSNRSD